MGSGPGVQTGLEQRGRRTGCRYKGLESRAALGCEQVPVAWEGGKDPGRHRCQPEEGGSGLETPLRVTRSGQPGARAGGHPKEWLNDRAQGWAQLETEGGTEEEARPMTGAQSSSFKAGFLVWVVLTWPDCSLSLGPVLGIPGC